MRLAILGAGVSGLACAFELERQIRLVEVGNPFWIILFLFVSVITIQDNVVSRYTMMLPRVQYLRPILHLECLLSLAGHLVQIEKGPRFEGRPLKKSI